MIKYLTLAVVLLALVQLSSQAVNPLPAEVTAFSGSRAQRYYHLFFHSIRLNFLRLGMKQQHAIQNLGWMPPRSASAFKTDGTEIALYGNDNGEDFIYMHRLMIGRVNKILKTLVNNPYKKIVGWKTIPAPGDKDYPVPATYDIPGQAATVEMITLFKSDDFYWDEIKPREDLLRDSDNLRGQTFGELGARLENEIHFFCHNRFSEANTVGYRIQNPMTPLDRVEEKWDALAYNWLGDFYSAHVHPTFWKIHGWVENRVSDWQKANSLDRVFFIGTWEGGPPEAFDALGKVSSIDENAADTSDSESSESSDLETDQNIGQIVELLVKLAH